MKRKLLQLLCSLICTCSIKVSISLKINKKVWGLYDFSMVINFTFMVVFEFFSGMRPQTEIAHETLDLSTYDGQIGHHVGKKTT